MSSINSPSNLPKTILVVDDEPDLVDLSAEFLVAEGYRVVKANDGAEAISILEKDKSIQFVFSDVRMPRVDGVGLLTHIKKNFPHINVCMVSGGSSYSEEDFLRLGACGYISKPYPLTSLIDIIGTSEGAVSPTEVIPSFGQTKPNHVSTVYVVEDEILDREILEASFKKLSFNNLVNVQYFVDGESIISHLANVKERPDLVVFDVTLPGMSGLETLAQIRRNKLLPSETRVIVLSHSDKQDDRAKAQSLNVDSYYQKPQDTTAWWHLARSICLSWIGPLKDHSI